MILPSKSQVNSVESTKKIHDKPQYVRQRRHSCPLWNSGQCKWFLGGSLFEASWVTKEWVRSDPCFFPTLWPWVIFQSCFSLLWVGGKNIYTFCLPHTFVVYILSIFASSNSTTIIVVLHALNCFSPVQLYATPWTIAYQAPLSMEFTREWVAMPFSRVSSRPRDCTHISCISYAFCIGMWVLYH